MTKEDYLALTMKTRRTKMTKPIPNHQARAYVQRKETFDGAHIFARWSTKESDAKMGRSKQTIYAVYSYGYHFPMFVYDADANVWVENSDKYSKTTSKHQSQLHPLCDTIKRPMDDVLMVIRDGICALLMKE